MASMVTKYQPETCYYVIRMGIVYPSHGLLEGHSAHGDRYIHT